MGTGPHLSLQSAMDLIDGVEHGQLVLHYQPLVSLLTGEVDSVEALVRWEHPSRGLLQPGAFLPQVQRSRLGSVVTTFVLRAAVAQWLAWRERGVRIGLAVNVPPAELADPTVPRELEDLVRAGFDPTFLTVEVTEGRLADIDTIEPALRSLSEQGARLSIDDFGTGDSTLIRLQRLRFHQIKIDRSFTAQVDDGGPARHIVRFATDLAHSLGMEVVVEGVEVADQLPSLRALEVDLVQGFHIGRPVDGESVLAQLGAG